MNTVQLEKGEELRTLIDTTREGLNRIDALMNEGDSNDKVYYKDDPYSLCISEHKDGSGISADLSRYWGNGQLLEVIRKELVEQLKYLENEFKGL